jgi:3-deoxy-D-manno-octulosonate 8-phosphate phosphatase (KDO 8-P phosphatase)
MMNVLEKFKPITTFVFDMDGVLTDGSLLVMPNGLMARRMNIKDGYALQLAVKKGYHVIVISGGNSPEVQERLHKLGVKEVYMRIEDKNEVLQHHLSKHNIQAEHVLFMGDDMPDYEVMKQVGLSCCPADAATDIQNIASYISPLKGGEGCARDVIEKVMKLQNNWHIDPKIKAQ